MKCHSIVLLLWITAASVTCDTNDKIIVRNKPNGIVLSCVDPLKLKINGEADIEEMNLEYKDENSGEYECVDPNDESESHKIYVKFRTCDNCVELDLVSLTGIAMGSLVATILIGVAVYQTASHSGSNVIGSSSFDRQHPVPYEGRNRSPNDHYQPLNHKGRKNTNDILTSKK